MNNRTISMPKTPAQKKKWEGRLKELEVSCPEGYKLAIPGQTIDMLGGKELWRIFENQSEPHLTRLPQDLVDVMGHPCAARVPDSWGRVLYYKVV